VSRGVCYAPAYTIQGGTNNVLRNIIGERVLGLPRG
jgi:alkylation response protein AidB-like acyl-CoA dehydrogenase